VFLLGCNCNNDFVRGESDRNRNRRDFTFDSKIRVDRDEFCRAVNRCIDDRIAGAENRNEDRDRRRSGWSWI
jgi:hypothetical protein